VIGLVILSFCLLRVLLISVLFAAEDGVVGASHHQDILVFDSSKALVEKDRVLLNCLEHVNFVEGLVF
jgi:hypothetical protein